LAGQQVSRQGRLCCFHQYVRQLLSGYLLAISCFAIRLLFTRRLLVLRLLIRLQAVLPAIAWHAVPAQA
jgi:hypothetical protein